MSAKEDAAYAEWIKDFKAYLPDELKPNFEALTAHDAGREVFRGNLRREDYNRRVNEVQAEKQRLQGWFQEEAPKNARLLAEQEELAKKLEAYERTLSELGLEDTPSRKADTVSTSVAKKEEMEELKKELDKKLQMFDQALPRLLGDLSTVIQKSVKENYNIDPREVLNYAAENQINPIQAFETLTKVEREGRAVAASKLQEEKWKEEGRREALSKLPNPDRIRPSGPSIIDTLNNKDFASDPRSRVDAAVKDFLAGEFTSSGSGLF